MTKLDFIVSEGIRVNAERRMPKRFAWLTPPASITAEAAAKAHSNTRPDRTPGPDIRSCSVEPRLELAVVLPR